MTAPSGWRMASLGDAFIDVHGDTDPFERDVERGVKKGAEAADDDAREAGRDLGESMGDGLGDSLKEQGPKLAKSIEDGLRRQKVRTKVTVQFDKDNNVVRKWVSTITDEIADAFDSADARGPTGFLGRIQTAIADAVGAGFNVSGRSPLIALLIPAIGAIVGLVLAALQAVNALVAVLITLPALIGAIGLQVGIVAIAFDGMGTAIQGAFEAKNAMELAKAIGDLAPSAQTFVRELLPLRDFFKELRFFVQENFFNGLGSLFGPGGTLVPLMGVISGFGPVARDLGEFFRELSGFFGSETFLRFVELILPSISRFLDRWGPSLVQFLDGLTALSTTAIPLLDRLGSDLSGTFKLLGDIFKTASEDPATDTWLDQMYLTLLAIENLGMSILGFVFTLLKELDEAGGKSVIQELATAFDRLAFFLSTPVGQKALEGLINLSIVSIQALTGLILLILSIIAAVQFAGEAIKEFFRFIWEGIQWLWDKVTGLFTGADDEIKTALGDVDNMLFNAGQRIITGLISGIRNSLGGLRNIMSTAAAVITSFLPFSPAEEGPLSGEGDPLNSGRKIVERLAAGITAGRTELGSAMTSATQNIVFGSGAIALGFHGALPTEEQAMATGQAAGAGISSILARNTRLAVRTL